MKKLLKPVFEYKPKFLAGNILNDALFFSSCEFNGLMKYSLITGEITYISAFIDEPFLKERLHKLCLVWNKWLFFIPQNSLQMHLYNVETGEQRAVAVADGNECGMISYAVICKDKLLIFPQFETQSTKIFDLNTFTLYVDDVFNEWFIKNHPSRPRFLMPRVCCHNNHIYTAFNLDNRIIDYFPENNKVDFIETDVNHIFGVFATEKGLWIHSRYEKVFEYIGDNNTIVKTVLDDKMVGPGQYTTVASLGEEAYALPRDAKFILHLHSDGSITRLIYPEEYKDIEGYAPNTDKFWGYTVRNGKLYIFPYSHDHMLEIKDFDIKCIHMTFKYDYTDESEPFYRILEEKEKVLCKPGGYITEDKLYSFGNFMHYLNNMKKQTPNHK